MQMYTIWHEHGKPRVSNEAHHEMAIDEDEVLGGIDALVEDRIRGEPNDAPQNEEVQTFDKLLNDAKREVYLGCTNYTLLKFVIELLNMKASRYKINRGRGKKIPHKVLRYFPLTPRLKRLYMSRKTAEDMRWHKEKRIDDGEFDVQHP
ncbi:hypothetical protein CsSME_00026743 [Camellia sinensis var. sinensis]